LLKSTGSITATNANAIRMMLTAWCIPDHDRARVCGGGGGGSRRFCNDYTCTHVRLQVQLHHDFALRFLFCD
jgi:hypothetical protein